MTAAAFSAVEIGGAGASLVAVARQLEAYAATSDPTPSANLVARIAAAVGNEPAPTPPVLFWRALSQGAAPAAFGYLAASVRAALGIGRVFPVAVRAQAIALILTVALVLAGGGAALAAGAAGVLHVLHPRPAPERPAVVDRSTTPRPATPTTKPKDTKPGSSGPGAGPRGGSGHDRDGEDRDDEEDGDDDGHDGDRSGPSANGRSDDGASSADRSDDERSGSSKKHEDSPASES
jgi:hypothetical protein